VHAEREGMKIILASLGQFAGRELAREI